MLKKILSQPLIPILLLAAFLRFFLLSRVPPSLNWDEISMGYTAYSVAETGRDEWGEFLPIFFRSYGEWKSAVYIYLLVPLVKLFGLNALTVRFPSALAGIFSVYLIYLLGRLLYSKKVGLWSAFFMTVTPWTFVLSRPAFEANVSLTLVLAGSYFFLRAAESSRLRPLFLSALFFGLAPHTYNSAKLIVPLLVIYLVAITKFYRRLKPSLLYFSVLAVFAFPLLFNLTTGRSQYRYTQVGVTTDQQSLSEFIDYRRGFPVSPLIGKLVFNRYTYGAYTTAANWFSYFDPSFLLFTGGNHNQHRLKYHGVLFLSEFIFILYGVYSLFSLRRPLRFFPLTVIALGFLPAALTRDTHHVLRTILATPGWVLLAGLGAAKLSSRRRLVVSTLFSLLGLEILCFSFFYFAWYPRAFARDWQYGYRELAAFLRTHQAQYDRIVMTKWYGEPQLFLAFYNHWDPLWYQTQNRPNLRYAAEGRLWLDQLPEYSLGKYTFKYLDWAEAEKSPRTLYIGKFDDFFEAPAALKTIYFPDGSVAFHLVEP